VLALFSIPIIILLFSMKNPMPALALILVFYELMGTLSSFWQVIEPKRLVIWIIDGPIHSQFLHRLDGNEQRRAGSRD
jgi:hypothetical protein